MLWFQSRFAVTAILTLMLWAVQSATAQSNSAPPVQTCQLGEIGRAHV